MATTDVISSTNQKIMGSFSGVNVMNVVGWIVFILIALSAIFGFYLWDKNRKTFTRKVTAFRNINNEYVPSIRDKAKLVKIGSGGFEILFLKKLKTWKIGFGGEMGKIDYYFFIGADGYWYPGRLSANMYLRDKEKGYIPVVTTNPTMRSQYTSLEKQIDDLHKEKPKFWDKYGQWIMSIAFVLISGVMLWLSYQEYAKAMGALSGLTKQLTDLTERLISLTGNVQTATSGGSGLIPAK
jgi:hypothetical protein